MSETPVKTCSNCHQEFPATLEYFYAHKHGKYGLQPVCKACAIERRRKHYAEHRDEVNERARKDRAEHPEKQREYQRKYAAEHRDEERERARKWYAEHRDKAIERARKYNAEHRDERNERARKWYAEHPDKVLESQRKWNAEHPEIVKARQKVRNMRRRDKSGAPRSKAIVDLYKRSKGKCYYCGVDVGQNYHIDHVIPLTRGGTNDLSNLVIACPSCNLRKHDKLPHEFVEGGRLL